MHKPIIHHIIELYTQVHKTLCIRQKAWKKGIIKDEFSSLAFRNTKYDYW